MELNWQPSCNEAVVLITAPPCRRTENLQLGEGRNLPVLKMPLPGARIKSQCSGLLNQSCVDKTPQQVQSFVRVLASLLLDNVLPTSLLGKYTCRRRLLRVSAFRPLFDSFIYCHCIGALIWFYLYLSVFYLFTHLFWPALSLWALVKQDMVQNTKCRLFGELWEIAAFRSMCF